MLPALTLRKLGRQQVPFWVLQVPIAHYPESSGHDERLARGSRADVGSRFKSIDVVPTPERSSDVPPLVQSADAGLVELPLLRSDKRRRIRRETYYPARA